MLIHDLYPVGIEPAGRGGARQRPPVHGVARRRRRAARRRRRRRRPDPARRQLRRLPGFRRDAGAGDQAGARRARTRSRPDSRSRGCEAAAGPELGADALALPVVQAGPGAADGNGNGAAAGGLDGRSRAAVLVPRGRACGPRGGLAADGDARRPRATRRQCRRRRCSPTWTGARTVAPGSARARWSRACSAAPAAGAATSCRGPGRSLDDDGLQLDPVPLLARDGSVRVALAG